MKVTSETNWVPLPYVLHLNRSMTVPDVRGFFACFMYFVPIRKINAREDMPFSTSKGVPSGTLKKLGDWIAI